MRPTSKVSILLVCSGVGLMLAFSSTVWPQDAKKVSPKVKELKSKRLEVLGEAFIEARALRIQGRIYQLTALAISAELFGVWREQAETPEERIKVIEEEVKEVEKLLEFAKERKAAGRGTLLDELMSQAYLLDAQIALENAKAAAPSPKVKELKAKRLEVLGEAFTETKGMFIKARIEFLTTLAVTAKFFEVRREQAETLEERIKEIEEEVQEAEKLLELTKERKAAARGTELAVQMSLAYLLEAQIALENAKAGE